MIIRKYIELNQCKYLLVQTLSLIWPAKNPCNDYIPWGSNNITCKFYVAYKLNRITYAVQIIQVHINKTYAMLGRESTFDYVRE